MQNLIDLLAAGFVFLLFAAVYRKRSTAPVRFWLLGWFAILLHFLAIVWPVHNGLGEQVQGIVFLSTLVLCAVSFVLSRQEAHRTVRDGVAVACLLGLPWLGALLFAMEDEWRLCLGCAYLSLFCLALVTVRWFGTKPSQLRCALLVCAGCTVWLVEVQALRSPSLVMSIVLTECFGLNAVLLSFGRPRFSAATVTTSLGAIAWGLVWISAAAAGHFLPHTVITPELWNVPKYLVASGMILTLLEEEIQSAALASEQYRLLFAGNPHPMWMYDPETLTILQTNDAARSHYGYSEREFCSRTLLDIFCQGRSGNLTEELRSVAPQQLTGPWLHQRKDGTEFPVDIACQPVLQAGHLVMFAMMHDVTEQQRLHGQLLRQAHHDALTGLPNRLLFEQRLEPALGVARDTRTKVAVMCVDLDRFKQINDSYGHAAGDQCLREAAARIGRCLEGRGTLARNGGDEFMLFVSGLREPAEAEKFAAEMLYNLSQGFEVGGADLELAASLGLALYPDDGVVTEQLWRDADAAMYQAKRAGGAQWIRVSDEISRRAIEANDIALALRRCFKAGEFEVHYQPQVTLEGGLYSFEALLRSKDRLLRTVPVDRVVGIAEEIGLIGPLGDWVLEEVCRQCRAWLDEGLPFSRIAVNLSPLQLGRFDFARQVARTLERYDLHPSRIEFEVTESTMMPDKGGQPLQQIAALAQMGIRFSVDDFGTGYSSLGRLHELPVDSLKIDRSFTRRMTDLQGTFPTVEAILALAHTLGMGVVAEGVEEERQLELLRRLGCDRVQGLFFSPPLSREAATSYLRRLQAPSLQHVVA